MVYASGKGVIAGLTVYLIDGYSTARGKSALSRPKSSEEIA